jgi:apolipoprotein N-acyltransferase
MTKSIKLHLHAILTGLLLTLAWMEWGTGLSLLIALIPLLLVESQIIQGENKKSGRQIFLFAFEAFFIWNLLSTWWIVYATAFGAFGAIIINTLLYSFIFWLYHITRKNSNRTTGYIALICYWIGFEYFYLNAEISWPWLNLGNGLANNVQLIQWYEYTGSLGGSLWILLSNILLFSLLDDKIRQKTFKQRRAKTIAWLALILIPVCFSLLRYYTYNEKNNPRQVVVLQPNIDPYNEKFGSLSNKEQLDLLLNLASTQTDSSTDYVIGPETAIENHLWEECLNDNSAIEKIRSFLASYPKAKMVVGATTHFKYIEPNFRSVTARYLKNQDIWFDTYNTALQIDSTRQIQIYHKSKLVVGVEMLPYPQYFKYLEGFAIDLGGTVGSLGTQPDRSVLISPSDSLKIGAAICYESIYGEFFAQFVKNGAQLMFIITNDGWWNDSPGYRQHFSYARIRAIETRRSIARSANTGRSAFINQRGDVFQPTEWWTKCAIKQNINANSDITFYVEYGDYIGRTCEFFAILILAFTLIFNILLRVKDRKTNKS